MSCKIKRRLRKTNQNVETPPSLNSPQRSGVNFESLTVSSSSPLQADKKPEIIRRKKIRSTQDFNRLSSNLTEDLVSSTNKTKIKRTKKAKEIYILPKIDTLGDSVLNWSPKVTLQKEGPLGRKSRRIIACKSHSEENDYSSDDKMVKAKQTKKENRLVGLNSEVNLIGNNISFEDTNKFDLEVQCCNVKGNDNLGLKLCVTEICTGECQTQNSVISSDQKDSEIDTVTKRNKSTRKKNRGVIMCTKVTEKSIRTSVSNSSNKETDINNPLLHEVNSVKLMNQISSLKNESCASGRLSTTEINVNCTQQSKSVDNNFKAMDLVGDRKKENSCKQSGFVEQRSDNNYLDSSGRTFNNTINNQEESIKNIKEKKNKISRSKSLGSSTSRQSIRKKKKSVNNFNFMTDHHDRSRNTITIADRDDKVHFDVFDKTSISEKKPKRNKKLNQLQKHIKNVCDLNDSIKMETRKSVRFLSPKEKINVRRSTFNLEESMFNLTQLKSLEENVESHCVSSKNSNNSSIFNKSLQNISTKDDVNFEVDKLRLLDQSVIRNDSMLENPSKMIISLSKRSLNKPVNEINAINKTVFSIDKEISKSGSKDVTLDLPSPLNCRSTYLKKDILQRNNVNSPENSNIRIRKASFQVKNSTLNERESVIDLITPETTPILKSIHKNSTVICSEKSTRKKVENDPSAMQLSRQLTFTKTVDVLKNESKVLTPSRLNSTATIIKEDTQNNLFDENYASPLEFDTSTVRNIDTSKVNKRKRWNKSRASVSFLDSMNIEDISAPWDMLNTSDQTNNSQFDLETNDYPKSAIREADLSKTKIVNQTLTSNRTLSIDPSKTSTPLPRSRNDSLRRALLKDKRKLVIKESNNLSKVEKPLTKSIRSKMPNFALIHQRAYDKMENLKEMSERKAVRAKLLLSGQKPSDHTILKPPSKSKKFLQFNPVKSKILKTTTPTCENQKEVIQANNSNIFVTKTKNISPSTSNLKVINKENKLERKQLIKASLIPKPNVASKVITERKGFTRYGFKVGSNSAQTATKEEQMKAISTKTKIKKNTVEDRRNVIQGVRSNRRFELLMRMRNK